MLNDGNPWKYFYESHLLEFVGLPENKHAKIEQYSLEDDCYFCRWKYDSEWDKDVDVSVNINLEGSSSSITWRVKRKTAYDEWVHNNNCIECLKCDHDTDQVASPKLNSLTIFVPKDFVYELSDDIGYEEGTNPFEFIANKCCYSITPRPESCTSLKTTYNIRTSGVVIGQNIESHVFALNSLGNTVDRTVNNVEDIKKMCQEIKKRNI